MIGILEIRSNSMPSTILLQPTTGLLSCSLHQNTLLNYCRSLRPLQSQSASEFCSRITGPPTSFWFREVLLKIKAYVFGYLSQALVDCLSGQWNLTLCLTMSTSMFCEYCGKLCFITQVSLFYWIYLFIWVGLFIVLL